MTLFLFYFYMICQSYNHIWLQTVPIHLITIITIISTAVLIDAIAIPFETSMISGKISLASHQCTFLRAVMFPFPHKDIPRVGCGARIGVATPGRVSLPRIDDRSREIPTRSHSRPGPFWLYTACRGAESPLRRRVTVIVVVTGAAARAVPTLTRVHRVFLA